MTPANAAHVLFFGFTIVNNLTLLKMYCKPRTSTVIKFRVIHACHCQVRQNKTKMQMFSYSIRGNVNFKNIFSATCINFHVEAVDRYVAIFKPPRKSTIYGIRQQFARNTLSAMLKAFSKLFDLMFAADHASSIKLI